MVSLNESLGHVIQEDIILHKQFTVQRYHTWLYYLLHQSGVNH